MINVIFYLFFINNMFSFTININDSFMKILKHLLVVIAIILVTALVLYYVEADNLFMVILSFLIISFFTFNSIIRKSLSFKSYFTSRYNIFTTKVRCKKSFDIPKYLMFDKIIEVINDSNFKLVDIDKEKTEILAISVMTFKSWGENLYIDFKETDNGTVMVFCSTTLFQMYSWGKNEKNYNDLLNEIKESLII